MYSRVRRQREPLWDECLLLSDGFTLRFFCRLLMLSVKVVFCVEAYPFAPTRVIVMAGSERRGR
jgi:hypothetical protein